MKTTAHMSNVEVFVAFTTVKAVYSPTDYS